MVDSKYAKIVLWYYSFPEIIMQNVT